MINVTWINDDNFKLDWTKDRTLDGQTREVTQQIYAIVMGWA